MKILIVEDEPLEARALGKLLEKYYADVIGGILLCGDGAEAVELARRERPDLVFMDIHLPGLDGVSAAAAVRETDENVEIVMLTAYADFGYAKASIANRVLEYMVKPYSAKTLRETMDRAVEVIEGKRRARNAAEDAQSLTGMLRKEFLHKVLVNFRLRREIIRRYVRMIGLHEMRYRILFFEAGESAFEALLSRLREAGIECMHTRFTRTACVIPCAVRASELAGPVDRIATAWLREYGPAGYLAGAVEEDWEEIAVKFHEMLARLVNPGGVSGAEPRLDALEENLGEAVISRDAERTTEACRDLVDAAYRLYTTSNDFGYALIAAYRGLAKSAQTLGHGVSGAEEGEAVFNIPYRGDRDAAFADLNAAALGLVARLEDGVRGNASRLTGLVRKYIDIHYAENITLDALARHASLSRFHLSRLFRLHEKETIVGYLRRVRVENAKRVLLAGGTAAEACYKCGFSDPAYFGKTFKRLTGMSPAAFQRFK